MELERLINEISVKMRLRKIAKETKATGQYSEREILYSGVATDTVLKSSILMF